jgi:hypothetical protein
MSKDKKQPSVTPAPRYHSPLVRCSARRAGCAAPSGFVMERIPVSPTVSPEEYAVRHHGWMRLLGVGWWAVACPGCAASIEREAMLATDPAEADDWPSAFGGKATWDDGGSWRGGAGRGEVGI